MAALPSSVLHVSAKCKSSRPTMKSASSVLNRFREGKGNTKRSDALVEEGEALLLQHDASGEGSTMSGETGYFAAAGEQGADLDNIFFCAAGD